jgi:hypothetical protein
MMTADWNPLFVAYAAEGGRPPQEQLVLDAFLFPGGKMTGFILWRSQKQAA